MEGITTNDYLRIVEEIIDRLMRALDMAERNERWASGKSSLAAEKEQIERHMMIAGSLSNSASKRVMQRSTVPITPDKKTPTRKTSDKKDNGMKSKTPENKSNKNYQNNSISNQQDMVNKERETSLERSREYDQYRKRVFEESMNSSQKKVRFNYDKKSESLRNSTELLSHDRDRLDKSDNI